MQKGEATEYWEKMSRARRAHLLSNCPDCFAQGLYNVTLRWQLPVLFLLVLFLPQTNPVGGVGVEG